MIVICMLATLGAFMVLFAVAWVVREFWRINVALRRARSGGRP